MLLQTFMLSLLAVAAAAPAGNWTVGQIVNTTSGPVQGHASKFHSGVSEYLSIPFAQPPVGTLRWSYPRPLNRSHLINGTLRAPSCPSISVYNAINETTAAAANLSQAYVTSQKVQAQSSGGISEDCLTLSVWTKPQAGEDKKAVLVYIPGGGFSSGGTTNPFLDGSIWAEEQDVVAVSINYRLDIFGFPGHPDTAAVPYNLGLMDQRLALEWTRDNINEFHGDPKRITIFGASAGAASVDFLSYDYRDDPIASGFILESGTSTSFGSTTAEEIADGWFVVSTSLGCGDASSNPQTVLDCMRNQTTTDLVGAIPAIQGVSAEAGSSFVPTIDEKLVFADFTSHEPAKGSLLLGSNQDEANLFRTNAAIKGIGANISDAFWENITESVFTCHMALRANLSLNAGVPTWRYRYFGAFPNTELTTYPPSGAYHSSQDLPLFGNSALAGLNDTQAETEIGQYMRGAWAAFAKDPVGGLKTLGWPEYNPTAASLVELAVNDTAAPIFVRGDQYDTECTSRVAVTRIPEVSSSTTALTPLPTVTSTNDANVHSISMEVIKVLFAVTVVILSF